MRSRQWVAETLRRAGKATPGSLRGPIGRVSRRFRSGFGGPLVSVVVAVSDAECTRIGPLLWDLRNQSHRNLEVLLQPWGPDVEVRRVAGEHADDDWRLRLARESASDPAAARNAGAAQARGAYLIFVGSGDNLPPRALDRLVDSLERSGSDLAVGRMRRPAGPLAAMALPYEAAHHTQLSGTDLASAPVAVTDLALGNRMLRRSFWAASGLRFTPERPAGLDVALDSYTRATRFDLLAEDTYIPTGRRTGVSVGSTPDVLARLDGWLTEHEQTWADLVALDSADVRDWWLWGVLDTAVQPFIDDAERADDAQWRRLRDHVQLLLETAGEHAWSALRAESRVKLWLVGQDRRAELVDLVTARLFERGSRPTRVVDGVVVADLPYRGDPAVGVPDDCYLMTEAETPLHVTVRGVRWCAADRLELDLTAFVDHVDLPEAPEVAVSLVRPGAPGRVVLDVRATVQPEANLGETSRRYQDFSRGGLVAVVDLAALAEESRAALPGGPVCWQLDVRLRTQGLTRRGPVTRLEERGSAGMTFSGFCGRRRLGDVRVGPVGSDAAGFAIEVDADSAPALVEAEVRGRVLRGALRGGAGDLRTLRVQMGSIGAKAALRPDGDLLRFELEVPKPWVGREHVRWAVAALTAQHDAVPVAWTAPEPWLGVGDGQIVVRRSGAGDVEVLEAEAALVVEEMTMTAGALQVTGHWLGAPPATAELVLAGEGQRTSVALPGGPSAVQGTVQVALPLVRDAWGLGERPLPPGRYLFELDGPLPVSARVLVGPGILDQLDRFSVEHGYRFRPARRGADAAVQLLAPLSDDERGPVRQVALQQWSRTHDEPLDAQAVYLQSYTGMSATDSQLAIHEELRRTHPGLRLYWGVASPSSWVPEGGIAVQMHSREWYRVISTAKYLCLNIDFDRWFAKRPGQQMLQTFHGYPAKSMGIRMWEAKGYTPRRIDLELARTSGDWDLILTPAPEMDEYYRREYRYDGPIHSAGYPRDDVLVSARAEAIRAATRARLGIAEHQTAVLYAPTWRDDQADNWRSAEMVAHLDVETASRQLGGDYVMLMRGHRFHAPPQPGAAGTRMIDVSSYPEINDLILASDAAVLDYSSLRFDFALTRRPMIFLVPDLAAYTGGVRGFLYPFADSAPGPLVDTAEEVIDLLRRLPEVAREHAAQVETFHRTYNYLQDGHAAERVVKAFWG